MSGGDLADALPLEQEQIRLDIELKRSELEQRRTELRFKEDEHALKIREIKASSWKNPLVVAVLAAAVAATGNAVVAVVNNNNLRDVEERKAQSSLILEAVKTGDPDRASVNLKFLLDAGLLSDSRAEAIRLYIQNRAPGTGAALPAGSGRFRLEGAADLPEADRATLSERLTAFVGYLDRVGLRTATRQVSVVIDREVETNSFFDSDSGSVRVGANIASDPFAALWAYAQFALMEGVRQSVRTNIAADSLINGLSDYFPASHLNEPRVGAGIAAVLDSPDPYLRNLQNNLTYTAVLAEIDESGPSDGPLALGEVWGGAFWQMRAGLGHERADRLLAGAWISARRSGRDQLVSAFVTSLLASARRLGENETRIVEAALRSRHLPMR